MSPSTNRRDPHCAATWACALALALSMGAGARAQAPAAGMQAPAVSTADAWDLGAVLEMRRPNQDGLEVLATTPDGAATRMGLQPGDRIRTINARSLTGPGATAAYAEAISNSGGQVQLEVLRSRSTMQLAGRLTLVSTQAVQGCGYVTTLGPTPRMSEGIFAAEITMIDGNSTPLTPQNRHHVPAGRRVLVVAEHIEDHRFTDNQNLQRRLMKQRMAARAYKALIVEVAPDTTYSIGARMLMDKRDTASIRANAYWEPVAWRQRETRCP